MRLERKKKKMLTIVASGNVTRDAVLRQVGEDQVCSVGIACNRKGKGGEEKVTFIDLSIWGKRGAALHPHLTKGKKLFVTGELETREHEGKFYLQCRVAELEFGGGGNRNDSDSGGGGSSGDEDDKIPF